MIIQLNGISKLYRVSSSIDPINVLHSINLTIEKPSMVAIIGESGAGKSTLLHIMGGLEYADSGEIMWKDQSIESLSDNKRAYYRNRMIGFVFQFHHLLPEFTALENVLMPSWILQKYDKSKTNPERARILLSKLGLESRMKHYPLQLSGGEQQRIAIARALINQPVVVLADEPTGNLDAKNSHIIMQYLLQLHQSENQTIIISTHDPIIMKYCQIAYELKDGYLKQIS